MKKYDLWGLVPLMLTISLIASGCAAFAGQPEFRTREGLLGTVINITIFEGSRSASTFDAAFRRVEEVHGLMAVQEPESDTFRLNHSGGKAVDISADSSALLSQARTYSELSGGAFDITVEPLTALWDIRNPQPRAPSPQEIEALLPLVDWRRVSVEEGFAQLEEGMQITLGGIAKGYACAEAAQVLQQKGVRRAILDFGGNVYLIGQKADGVDWKVGIRNPVIGEAGEVGALSASNTAVVTSGSYERYFIEDNQLYHHILDPETGWPAQSGLLSVTIICSDSVMADALSTACFVLGAEDGLALLERLPGVEGVFIEEDRGIRMTSGLEGRFQLLDDRFFVRESL